MFNKQVIFDAWVRAIGGRVAVAKRQRTEGALELSSGTTVLDVASASASAPGVFGDRTPPDVVNLLASVPLFIKRSETVQLKFRFSPQGQSDLVEVVLHNKSCQRCTQTQRSSANRRARSNFYPTQCTELTTETSSSS